jgi:glycosyltransferase involved in cell wall biosynthesis
MARISAVVPVYRSEACLPEFYERLSLALSKITEDYEIVFVEDCGGDRSWEIIQSFSKSDSRVRGVQFSMNFGQQAATLCGFYLAKGEWIVTIDDDLEQNPADIEKLYEKAQLGYSLVYGTYSDRTHSTWRNVTSTTIKRLFKIAIPTLNTEYTSFRIIERKIAKEVCKFTSPFPFVDGYVSWLTTNTTTMEVSHSHRFSGVSNYTFGKLTRLAINTFVTFSDMPLKAASWCGILFFLVGMAGLSWVVLAKVLGGITVSGFASVMSGIFLFGGIQLLVLGVLGEYIGRINFKSSQKPLYLVVDETENITMPETEKTNE